MSKLQIAGLIRINRGRVTLLDRSGLEEASCECYAVIRQAFDRLLGLAPGEPLRNAAAGVDSAP